MAIAEHIHTSVFDHTVCAVDGSEGSLEAIRQATLLGDQLGEVELVGVFKPTFVEPSPAAIYSSFGAPLEMAAEERAFTASLKQARALCPEAAIEVLYGPAYARLIEHLRDSRVTLVAVGSSTKARPLGAVMGSVPTGLLHSAPCSVLVARRRWTAERNPLSIVAGYDGSPGSIAAIHVGRDLVERLGARLRVIAARGATAATNEDVADLTIEWDDREPVEALKEASRSTDLLLLGSRGLHGLKAIGSVSEKLGHQSACSVLVVRPRAERQKAFDR